jgi:hypothetical protein
VVGRDGAHRPGGANLPVSRAHVETPPHQPRLRERLGGSLAPPDVRTQEWSLVILHSSFFILHSAFFLPPLSPIAYRLSPIAYWLLAIGYWLLAIGYDPQLLGRQVPFEGRTAASGESGDRQLAEAALLEDQTEIRTAGKPL